MIGDRLKDFLFDQAISRNNSHPEMNPSQAIGVTLTSGSDDRNALLLGENERKIAMWDNIDTITPGNDESPVLTHIDHRGEWKTTTIKPGKIETFDKIRVEYLEGKNILEYYLVE